jgi:O-antigen/teichoic acid export membrane protein
MNKYKNLLLNTGLFALSTIGTKLITFLLVPLYTYYLTSAQFGVTDMSLIVISLITPLATLSASDAVLRFAVDDSENKDAYITIGLCVMCASCVIVAVLTPLLDLHFFGGLGQYKMLFVLAYAVNALQAYGSNVSRALNQVKVIPVASIATAIVTAGSAVVFIAYLHQGAVGYFYSIIAGGLCGLILYIFYGHLIRHITVSSRASNLSLLKRMLLYAIPLVPNALFWWIGTSVNRFFITGMLGIAASGLFAAASKIPNLVNMIYDIFQQSWTLSAFQEFKHSNLSKFFSTIFSLLNAGLMLLSSGIILLASPLASLLLQKEFYSVWTLIPIFILAFYFNAMNSFYGSIYTSNMKTRYLFSTTVVGSIAVIIGSWTLIPRLGLQGAGIAMVIGNALVLVTRMVNSRRLLVFHINWFHGTLSLVLLTVQAAITGLVMPHYRLWSLALFLVLAVAQIVSIFPYTRKILAMAHAKYGAGRAYRGRHIRES